MLSLIAALAAATSLAVPAVAASAAPSSVAADVPVVVPASSPDVLHLGRWDRSAGASTTVNSGSRVILRFTGAHIALLLDQSGITFPPQLYAAIDGAPPVLVSANSNRIDLTPAGLSGGAHTLVLAVKDIDEGGNRWNPPLRSALRITGFEIDPGATLAPSPAPTGPRIEFLGDSITQGVRALNTQPGVAGSDATKGFAWLTGNAFGGNFRQVGFGAQGLTRPGNGNVPVVSASLTLNYRGSPIDPSYVPDAVVINQGANDALANANPTTFRTAYEAYLRQVRALWPNAWIFAMRPFGGHMATSVAAAVPAVGDPRIVYVDTTGWIPRLQTTDDLHPTVVGHQNAARRLVKVIERRTGWRAADIDRARARLLALGGSRSFEGAGAVAWRAGQNVSAVALGTPAYEGSTALQVTSATAPLGEWRTVDLTTRAHLSTKAQELFAFVRPIPARVIDVRMRVVRGGRVYESTVSALPNLAAFIPWNRVSVAVPGQGRITEISLSVRAAGGTSTTPGVVSFVVDDLGWTDTATELTSIPVPD
nr:SGNH/GDSL hydrolase family protein [Motilibacter deserti]